jgi:hypothetical protein
LLKHETIFFCYLDEPSMNATDAAEAGMRAAIATDGGNAASLRSFGQNFNNVRSSFSIASQRIDAYSEFVGMSAWPYAGVNFLNIVFLVLLQNNTIRQSLQALDHIKVLEDVLMENDNLSFS